MVEPTGNKYRSMTHYLPHLYKDPVGLSPRSVFIRRKQRTHQSQTAVTSQHIYKQSEWVNKS